MKRYIPSVLLLIHLFVVFQHIVFASSDNNEIREIKFRVVQSSSMRLVPDFPIGFMQDGTFVAFNYLESTISPQWYLYRGPVIFNLTKQDGSILGAVPIPSDGNDFLLFLNSSEMESDKWNIGFNWMAFDSGRIPLGTYYLVNKSKKRLHGNIANIDFILEPEETKLINPGINEPTNILANFREGSPSTPKVLANLAWYHQPKIRRIIYLQSQSEQNSRLGFLVIADYSSLMKDIKPANTLTKSAPGTDQSAVAP